MHLFLNAKLNITDAPVINSSLKHRLATNESAGISFLVRLIHVKSICTAVVKTPMERNESQSDVLALRLRDVSITHGPVLLPLKRK